MPRARKCRRICGLPRISGLIPVGDFPASSVSLQMTLDEYEVIRLMDLEKLTQEQCAARMGIARTTVTGIYESARTKLAMALVNGHPLTVSGGDYRICGHSAACMKSKEESPMKIAVTYENGEIFQHFGHTEAFKIYETENGTVLRSEVVSTNGSGHGALAGFLTDHGVQALICGGIGAGAQNALKAAGIRLYGGVSGSADEAVNALLAGSLSYNPDITCTHHEGHEHSCHGDGGHGCGGHGDAGHECGGGHGNGHSCGGH